MLLAGEWIRICLHHFRTLQTFSTLPPFTLLTPLLCLFHSKNISLWKKPTAGEQSQYRCNTGYRILRGHQTTQLTALLAISSSCETIAKEVLITQSSSIRTMQFILPLFFVSFFLLHTFDYFFYFYLFLFWLISFTFAFFFHFG